MTILYTVIHFSPTEKRLLVIMYRYSMATPPLLIKHFT